MNNENKNVHMTTDDHYDLLIVGGGLVGASLACALAGLPLRIAVIEAFSFGSQAQPGYDDRSIALAYGTRRIFEGMGLWQSLVDKVTAINKIHVSDKGHFGAVRMNAAEEGRDALGYVIENRDLGAVLTSRLKSYSNIDWICPARVIAYNSSAKGVETVVERDGIRRTLTSKLLVGADGGNSAVRKMAGIKARRWDYKQSAIIANVSTEKPHNNIAYERFTDSGPLAMLPMSRGRCSLVWTVDSERTDEVLALDDQAFLGRLQERFGLRLGRISRVGKRSAYPLSLVRAREGVGERLALIGNAAHTLHPIAGQGFNLGLRDVAALVDVLAEAVRVDGDIGAAGVLADYEQWRRQDQTRVSAFTDGLVRIFSNSYTPVVAARNTGLLVLDMLPPLKLGLMHHTMGLSGKLPRLARGLPL